MISELQLAKIVELRGLGYTQAEIAAKIGLTAGQVNYQLSQVNKKAKVDGDDETYVALMATGVGPELIRLVGAYKKYA